MVVEALNWSLAPLMAVGKSPANNVHGGLQPYRDDAATAIPFSV